jgi:hypothetical protein
MTQAVARQAERPRDGRSRNGGRNGSAPVYSEELAEEICDRLATGESLYAICQDAHMPTEKAVRLWVETRPDSFAPMYTRAREFGYDSIAEAILSLGTDKAACSGPDGYIDNGEVQRLRMLSENRKWLLSKMQPKRYGDKVTQEITGEDGGALITRIELVPVPPKSRLIEHIGSPEEARNSSGMRNRRKP